MSRVRPRRRRAGFTLVELLVVTAILGLLVGAIGACIAAGLRVWDQARRFGVVQHEATLGLALLERDLVNAFRFFGVPFRGEATDLSVPGLVFGEGDGQTGGRIGTIRYVFEPEHKRLARRTWPYRGGTAPDAGEEVVAGVHDVVFRYYAAGKGADAAAPADAWLSVSNFPRRVEVALTFVVDGERVSVARTVVLPLGGAGVVTQL